MTNRVTRHPQPRASKTPTRRRAFLTAGVVLAACLAITARASASQVNTTSLTVGSNAAADPTDGRCWYTGSGIPPGSHIPPWGFHAPQSFPGGGSGFAYGWGHINLDTNWISGTICQDVSGRGRPARTIAVSVGPQISYHSHIAVMWGYPGNLIKTSLKVISSTDPRCKVGTSGRVIMYASYNGVRSDSMQFFFDAGCRDQDHLYHGPQVAAQVPPL